MEITIDFPGLVGMDQHELMSVIHGIQEVLEKHNFEQGTYSFSWTYEDER